MKWTKQHKVLSGIIAVLVILNGLFLFKQFGPGSPSRHQVATNQIQSTRLNLDPEAKILVEELVPGNRDMQVLYRVNKPLYGRKVIEKPYHPDSPVWDMERLPWYYGMFEVDEEAIYSSANEYPVVLKEEFNDYNWRLTSQGLQLYQADEPFTGYHRTLFEGHQYFDQGKMQRDEPTLGLVDELTSHRRLVQDLAPVIENRRIYLTSLSQYHGDIDARDTRYSITYLSPDQVILTAPPGIKGSRLAASTEDFVNMPMDVVGEMHTTAGDWLQVTIGYDTIGWVPKDLTQTEYHHTNYSERELLDEIRYAVQEIVDIFPGNVGVSFVHNETMAQVSVANKPFFPASTQKIYVLGEVYHQYVTQELDADHTIVTLTDADRVGGAGTIQGYPTGTEFSVNDLVDLVVTLSDNTAANMLIDTVGGGAVMNPHVHQLGLIDTIITGKYYHPGLAFQTTPANAATFFALLYNDRLNGKPWDEALISKFSMNTHNFLRSTVGNVISSWNKSGLGETEQNDVATFMTDVGSYSLAVYTSDPAGIGAVQHQMAYISSRVNDIFVAILSGHDYRSSHVGNHTDSDDIDLIDESESHDLYEE